MTWKCITLTPEGHIYNYDHHWVQGITILGYTFKYTCINCDIEITRREFKQGKHTLYKDLPKYE